ncbi:MAG: hypothetical protein ACRBK7_18440 [Acidimicrobiales bacterium]
MHDIVDLRYAVNVAVLVENYSATRGALITIDRMHFACFGPSINCEGLATTVTDVGSDDIALYKDGTWPVVWGFVFESPLKRD